MTASPPPAPRADCAVLTTLYRKDDLGYFDLAIRSIRDQDHVRGDIRIYLYVDGEISPEQERFLAEHAGWFHRIFRGEWNLGLARALNFLLGQIGDEDYVFRMDGDDLSKPDRFSTQIAFLERNPAIDLCGCQSEEIDEHGAVLNTRDYPLRHEDIRRSLSRCNPVLHPTYCIRGSSLRRDRLRYPDLYLTEDLGFLHRAVLAGWTLANCPARCFQWRVTANFFRRRNLRRAWVEFTVLNRIIWDLHGPTYRFVYPLIRLVARMLPPSVTRLIYRSGLRDRL
jgi:glycosyltransferase involved in cell wall biosynthesis